jgi:hypothetical protein
MSSSTAVTPGYFRLPWYQIQGTNPQGPSGNFEDALAELGELVFGFPQGTTVYGRSGQDQHGIDVQGQGRDGILTGIQCKLTKEPKKPEEKVKQVNEWFNEWHIHRSEMKLGRLVIAAPWSRDTHVVDACVALQRKHRNFKVEFWFADTLDRLISPYVEIIHRHFGPKIAFDAESFRGSRLAAAYQTDPIDYFGLRLKLDTAEAKRAANGHAGAARVYEEIAKALSEHGLFGESASLLESAAFCHQKAGNHSDVARFRLTEASRLFTSGQFLTAQRTGFLLDSHLPPDDPNRRLWEVYKLLADSYDYFEISTARLKRALKFLAKSQTPEPNSQTLLLSLGELALLIHDEKSVKAIAKVINLHIFVGTDDEGRAEAFLIDAGVSDWSPSDVSSYRSDRSKVIAWMRQGTRLARSFDIGSKMVDVTACKSAFEQARFLAFENRMFDLAYEAQRCIATLSANTGMFKNNGELHMLSQGVNTISHHSVYTEEGRLAESAAVSVVTFPKSAFNGPIQKCAKAASNALAQGCLEAEKNALQILVGIARSEGNKEIADLALVLAGQNDQTGTESGDVSLRAVALVRRGNPLWVRVAAADYIASIGSALSDEIAESILDDLIQLATTETDGYGRQPWLAGRPAVNSIAGSITCDASRKKIVSLLKDYAVPIVRYHPKQFVELCKWTYRWSKSPAEIADMDCWLLGFATKYPENQETAEDVFLFRLNHFGGTPKEVLASLSCVAPIGFGEHIVHQDDEPSAALELAGLIRKVSKTKTDLPPIRGRSAKLLPTEVKVKAVTALLLELERRPDHEKSSQVFSSLLAITDSIDEISAQLAAKIARALKSTPEDLLEHQKILIEPLRCNLVSTNSVGFVMGDLSARVFSSDPNGHTIAAQCLERLWRRKIDFLPPQNFMQHPSSVIRERAFHELIVRGAAPTLSQNEELKIRLFAAKHRSHFPDFNFDEDTHSLVRFTANDPYNQCKDPLHETKHPRRKRAK